MVNHKYLDLTLPRAKLKEGENPLKSVEKIYGAGRMRPDRSGGKPGKPTPQWPHHSNGMSGYAPGLRNEPAPDPLSWEWELPSGTADRRAPGYNNDVRKDWRVGFGSPPQPLSPVYEGKSDATDKPYFDSGIARKPAKSLGGGGDAKKSPFSKASKTY